MRWMWVVFVRGQDRITSKKTKFSEAYPEAAIRDGADELTLRAEEVRTLTACIDVDHSENDRWRPPFVDADWHAFCQAIEEVHCHYREMSRATATKKPRESEKAKALWAMKAAKEREKEYYDSARKDNILGRGKTRLELWEEHLKDPIVALDKALTCLENQPVSLAIGSKRLVESCVNGNGLQWCGYWNFAKDVGKDSSGKASGLSWTRGTVCVCAQRPPVGMFQGSVGRMASSSSSFSGRSRWWIRTTRRPTPSSLLKRSRRAG